MLNEIMIQTYLLAALHETECEFTGGKFNFGDEIIIELTDEGFKFEVREETEFDDEAEEWIWTPVRTGKIETVGQLKTLLNETFS